MSPPVLPRLRATGPAPLVSVVMPTYNRADLLPVSARMVLDQSLRDLELVISDDHSTDATPEAAAELARRDPRVVYHRPAHKGGITGAVNGGILRSRGRFVQICHDHDIFLPTLTEKLAGVLRRHPSVAFAHPGRQGCDHEGRPLARAYFVCGYPEVSDGRQWRRLMLSRLASPVTGMSMIRRSALEEVGLFDPEFGACSDVEMWLRLCAVGDVGYANELLLYVRGRDPAHPYAGVNWEITDEVIRAHRKHLALCYTGWAYRYWKFRREMAIDLSLLRDFLNAMRHRRWDDVARGRHYLRSRGVLLSRGAAMVL